MRRLLVLGVALACTAAAHGQAEARGMVYNDLNSNSILDNGEPGVPDVCVSNGRDLVVTDESGKWSLPSDDDCTLFVIKPAGWGVQVNSDQIPQYFYHHKPKGSPVKQVAGVPPTGPLPPSINFAVFKQDEPAMFDVLLFGDPQARGTKEVDFVTHDVVEECAGTSAAFGISLGDIVADDPGLFTTINQSIGQIGIPWYNTFGNHDYNRDATANEYADDTYELVYGPSTYAFEYGEVSFINLNDVFFKPDGKSVCRFTDDQLSFVKAYLERVSNDRLVVLLMHIPFLRCENRDDFFSLFSGRPKVLAIAAHTHTQFHRFVDKAGGWPGANPLHLFVNATVCGSWWCGAFDERGIPHATMNDGAPNGYSVLTFNGAEYSIRFKASRRPADYQMNIYLPSEIQAADVPNTDVLVNVFAGSSRSRVDMRIDRGEWIPLEQSPTEDPDCKRMSELGPYLDQEVLGKKLDTVLGWKMDPPSVTDHMWKGKLAGTLAPGTHTVHVRTTDMFGQEFIDRRIIRVK
ncbi:MAG: calcineurin-like phosphoesterase C-terminal domain-containing protein [Candidatus Hydrogenedentes bacterium]|nr:calcineurin-like phosphoesterase C-terminal domain-containing protein [Candidatus Hydrogenedentota bacterium]